MCNVQSHVDDNVLVLYTVQLCCMSVCIRLACTAVCVFVGMCVCHPATCIRHVRLCVRVHFNVAVLVQFFDGYTNM